MTSTEKLIKKEFKIKTEADLMKKIAKKNDDFFQENFFTSKENYLYMIKELIKAINETGAEYSNYQEMVGSGSIISSGWASAGFGDIQKKYKVDRKKLVNHVRFFV